MIPSVVVQLSCPTHTPRHLDTDRYDAEELWANEMVDDLRKLGLHARDVHSEHHGIVIIDTTPLEFATMLRSTDLFAFISKYKMERWSDSYIATFI